MPPYHVQNPHDYGLWLDQLIGRSPGYLDPGLYPVVDVLVHVLGDVLGAGVPRQRLRFHDGTSLYFEIVVDADLEPVKYSFHFQRDDGTLIWRKDWHIGHEDDVGGLAHIHDEPQDPDAAKPFHLVEFDEVLEQVADYQKASGS
jgi:Family of unknown function (DUF6516)